MRVRHIIIAGLLVFAPALAAAQDRGNRPQFAEKPGAREFSGRLIVRPLQAAALRARGANAAQIALTRRSAQFTLAHFQKRGYESRADLHVIDVPPGLQENEVIGQLMDTGLFEYAEPDWTVYPIVSSNDPRLGSQWHHDASHLNSLAAWDLETGSSTVTVGICDTGIQTSHPDLQGNRKEGYNAVDRVWESQGGAIEPVHWHGTGTTGCAAANGNNGEGVSGVGWNLGHRMMRVSNVDSGSASISNLIHAALTSIEAGDKVANVSYSGVNSSSVRTAATQIKAMGGLLVWSAGNDGANLDWGDRDADDLIVVGATTQSDAKASFSAYGASVDLVAPGSSVLTTYTGSSYANVSGTSFSAPLTAGLIALIWSHAPELSPDQVEDVLKQSCDDLGSAGADNTFGHGRINAYEALVLAGGAPTNPPPTVTISTPSDNATFTAGDSVTFTATAVDEGSDISGSLAWSSSIDGPIGTGATFSITTLTAGTHTVTASVVDSLGAPGSDTVQVVIEADLGAPPAAPAGLVVTGGGDGTAALGWSDRSTDETEFEIQRETQHKSGRWQSTTSLIAAADAESYTDSAGSGTFRYRIRANNAAGSSSWTGWVTVDVTGGGKSGGNGRGGKPK